MLDWLLLRGSLIALCILANAFFVAAEFALISVRETRVEHLVARNRPAARTALRLKREIEQVLPAVQLGVTLANLVLGGLGEPTLAAALEHRLTHLPAGVLSRWGASHPALLAHGIAIPVAFCVITFLEVVLGELVPKSLALQRTERIALAVAGPVDIFIRISRPIVALLNSSAGLVLKLFRAPLRGEMGGAHSPEELKMMTSATRRLGLLPVYQEEIVHRALELGEVSASAVMTPRTRIFSLPANMALEEATARIVEEEHSRVPVYEPERGPDAFVGVVYAKDLFRLTHFRGVALRMGHRGSSGLTLRQVMRDVLVVPETKPVLELLQEFQERRRQIAIVVDEFGSTLGLVTAEDALEQLVGELEDEFDTGKPIVALANGSLVLEGTVNLRDLATQLRWELPRTQGVETLAGLILAKLGHIPIVGETVEFEGRRFEVVGMDRHRIARVRVDPISAAEGEGSDRDQPELAGSIPG
ncbi:MAG TPA: hemolysin family protein [Acidobacteriaceae bacterium]|nr:hemolysin family protein [Acidobacteriaceae bacterium]